MNACSRTQTGLNRAVQPSKVHASVLPGSDVKCASDLQMRSRQLSLLWLEWVPSSSSCNQSHTLVQAFDFPKDFAGH